MKIVTVIILVFSSILGTIAQRRIDIPGSRASILIPEGILISPHYSAITKPDVFEMSIIEFQGNLESKFREIDSAAYVQRGIKVYEEYEMIVDGYRGKVIHGYSSPDTDVIQFLFGDHTFFIMASTMYTRGDKKLHNEIIGYYKSIKVNKSKNIDWNKFIAINYDENSSFKLEKEFINSLAIIFKQELKKDSSVTYITVQQFPNLGIFPNVESFLSLIVHSTILQSYELDEFISEGKINIHGKTAYEFSAYCISSKGERHLVKCIARLTDDLGTIVCAIVMNEKDTTKAEEFLQTMEFKN